MGVLTGPWAQREDHGRILTLGWFLSTRRMLEAQGARRVVREEPAPYRAAEIHDLDAAVRHTRMLLALKDGRRWPVRRLVALLDPMVAPDVAVAVVPSHDPFVDDTPIREVGAALAALGERVDATGALERREKIQGISLGGPSYPQLHRRTVAVAAPERVAGRAVLLLDDVVRSGASLRACRDLLREAGATEVQALALGKVAP